MAAALSAALTTLPAQRTKSLSQLLLPPVRMPLGLLMRQVVEGRCQRRQLVAKLMVWCVWATVFTLFVCVPPSTSHLLQFPASAKAAASVALPPRPSSARARAPSPSVRDSTDHSLPTRTRPATAHSRPSSHPVSSDAGAAVTASTVADILGAQSSSDDDEPLFENLNARASSALHSELSPRSRAFSHKVSRCRTSRYHGHRNI